MNRNFTILFLLISNFAFTQTNFNIGFQEGYKKGFCQDKANCIEPISPVAPIPKFYESASNYQDGYNRGFQEGLTYQKTNLPKQNNTTYQTSNSKFIEDKKENPYSNITNTITLAKALKNSKAKAIEYLEDENYKAVADICFAGLGVSPKDDEFMLLLGQAYRFSGDKANAIKWLKKASSYRQNDINLQTLISTIENE